MLTVRRENGMKMKRSESGWRSKRTDYALILL